VPGSRTLKVATLRGKSADGNSVRLSVAIAFFRLETEKIEACELTLDSGKS
jgi:hypothetical protein